MKVPKKLSDLLREKQEYIDLHRGRMEKSVIKLQDRLLNEVIAEILPNLDVKDGKILDTTKNYQILGDLDKVYKEFTAMSSSLMSSQISGVTTGLVNLGKNYFAVALTDDLGKRFDKVVLSTANKMNARIGLKGGEMVRGGFLDSFMKDQTLATQIKSFISKSVTGQIDTKDFIKGLGKIVTGDEGKGALEKQYERYAYDVYQQYDAAYNSTLADEFGMNYFIYQGGLINDSRDFCAAHNNKVWSRDEAEDWRTWTPSLGEYPEGYEVKSKSPYDVPSYLDYPGYDPLVDRGGYNCRHMLGWISDALAKQLREDLNT
jgi:hypothetical protein